MRSRSLLVALSFCVIAVAAHAATPPPPSTETRAERFKRQSQAAESTGLAEPFRGITTKGTPEAGLFTIKSTGVSTEPVRVAALAYLASLAPEGRKETLFAVDDVEWRKWMNQDFYVRQGVAFRDLGDKQRAAAFGLMRASLSAKGLQLSQHIMKLNHTLGEMNEDDFQRYGEGLYWITIMGQPSATEPWGWQVDGHHLIINYFVLGDQVVMSPVFLGSEPITATSGKYKGTTILQEEQNRALKFMQSLDEAQRKQATLSAAKTANNNLTEAFKDNVVLDYAGVRAASLPPAQQQALFDLIGLFVANLDDGHAKVKMDEVRAHLDATHFAWIGGTDENAVFYYRIHSPVVLIEFDHQRPINLRQLAKDPNMPVRQHIHVVVRTPNGNDYGKDLLRQHLLAHPH